MCDSNLFSSFPRVRKKGRKWWSLSHLKGREETIPPRSKSLAHSGNELEITAGFKQLKMGKVCPIIRLSFCSNKAGQFNFLSSTEEDASGKGRSEFCWAARCPPRWCAFPSSSLEVWTPSLWWPSKSWLGKLAHLSSQTRCWPPLSLGALAGFDVRSRQPPRFRKLSCESCPLINECGEDGRRQKYLECQSSVTISLIQLFKQIWMDCAF